MFGSQNRRTLLKTSAVKLKPIKLTAQKRAAMKRFIAHAKRLEYAARIAHLKMDREFALVMQDDER